LKKQTVIRQLSGLQKLSLPPSLLLARTEHRPPLSPLDRLTEPTLQRRCRKKIHPNICQIFILYSAWGFIFQNNFAIKSRPPKGGTTREARLEERQQRLKEVANLVPSFLSAKSREKPQSFGVVNRLRLFPAEIIFSLRFKGCLRV